MARPAVRLPQNRPPALQLQHVLSARRPLCGQHLRGVSSRCGGVGHVRPGLAPLLRLHAGPSCQASRRCAPLALLPWHKGGGWEVPCQHTEPVPDKNPLVVPFPANQHVSGKERWGQIVGGLDGRQCRAQERHASMCANTDTRSVQLYVHPYG